MKNNIYLHITEHHKSVISGYKLWIGKETDFKLIGTSAHPEEAVKDCANMTRKPDVLILDYVFGEQTIIPYIAPLKNACPDAGLMAVTGYDLPYVIRALHGAGIDGIITKDEGADGFIQCIRAVAAGGIYQSQVVRQYLQEENKILDLLASLTPAEKKVLRQLATGMPDSEVRQTLGIAASTLDNHRTNVFTKIRKHGFEVFSKAELVGWYNGFSNELVK